MAKLTRKNPVETNKNKPSTPRKKQMTDTQLQGLAWCVKQAFSAWNGKRKDGTPKTNWSNPSASGQMILNAETYLRKKLTDKEYKRVFKKNKEDEF